MGAGLTVELRHGFKRVFYRNIGSGVKNLLLPLFSTEELYSINLVQFARLMRKPYICLSCYQRLLQPNQQFRRASFVSLGNINNQQDDSERQAHEEVAVNGEPTNVQKPRQSKRKSFAQQYQEQRKPVGVDKVLETLFSSTRNYGDVGQVSRYSRTPKLKEQKDEPAAKNTITDRRLLELHNYLQRGTSHLEYIWASCVQLLGERKWTPEPGEKEKVSFFVFRDILLAVCSKQWIKMDDTAVTPATVIETYRKHGVMKYWWHEVVWAQLGQAIRLKYEVAGRKPRDDARREVGSVLKNLLDVWSIFVERYKYASKSIVIKGDAQKHNLKNHRSPRNAIDQLFQLLPSLPNNDHAADMAAAAIVTLDLLRNEHLSCSPLLGDIFKRIHERGALDLPTATQRLSKMGISSEVIEKFLKERQRLPLERRSDWSHKSIELRVRDIGRALNTSDAEDSINLWESYLDYLRTNQSNDIETNDRILTRFLHLFWGIAKSDRAIDVWNHIVKSGRKPEQIHWLAMLNGCIRAEDTTSLQEIWKNLSRTRLEPDSRMWTTYIYGLIKGHRWQSGLQALESLGRVWKRSVVAGDPNSSTQQRPKILEPTIEPVRAALSAFIEIQKPHLLPTVVAWAESQKLQLDTYTYNILLNSLVQTGTQAQIQSHLAQMAEHKCLPDVVTFTIILKGLVSNKDSDFHAQPSEVQESTIASILKDMEDSGIPPNAQTYSTLINGLIGKEKPPQHSDIDTRNIPAARTILSHMQKKNMVPSRHLYAILIHYYFACSPPDLPAIGSLWASIRHSGQTANLDPFFYDRMVEGYADLDEIEKALQFLRVMPGAGKSPSWLALYRMLAALERAGEWDLCRELIRDVEDTNEGLLKHGQGHLDNKNDFYWLVDYLRGKGVLTDFEEQN